MKPLKEHIQHAPNLDWLIKDCHCRMEDNEFTCSWHYHAEYELVLYLDPSQAFQGNYFAGDAIGEISHHTLLLYGPGLPHMVAGKSVIPVDYGHRAQIVWFTHQWVERLQALLPESRSLKHLLENSAFGLLFSAKTAKQISALLTEMNDLNRQHQAIKMIELLVLLTEDSDIKKLAATAYRATPISEDSELNQRIERATLYIQTHYGDSIKIADLCTKLHMSESSAYRMFEKHYGVSFSEHLKQYRIGKACELLASSEFPISLVAEKTGFKNISNFNRQFKQLKSMTPTEFRQRFN